MANFPLLKDFWSNAVLHRSLLFFFAFLLYANTLTHDYTQDDAIVIYDNMFTTQGLQGIPGILQNDTFYGFFKEEGKAKLVSGGRYRPATLIMFAIEWEIFGRNPFIGHLVNVLLFAFLSILLYSVLTMLFRNEFDDPELAVFAFLASLIFVIHPIHTEVVANIKGRDEIMSLFLSLACLYFILKALDKSKVKYLIAASLLFLVALLSKENAIAFVGLIPLALYLFRTFSIKKLIVPFLVLLTTSIIFLIIRGQVLGWDFGGKSMELMNNPFLKIEGGKYVDFSPGEKWSTILFTLGKYLQLLVFPHPLTHDYYPRQIGIMSFGDIRVIFSLLIHLFLLLFAILRLRKNKLISYSILFYLGTLFIVSNILFPIGTNMSERFLFMPSVAFAILLSMGLLYLKSKGKFLFAPLLIVFVLLGSYKTFSRNKVWKDDFTLFTTDVKTSTNSAKVLNAAGGALVSKAASEKSERKKKKMLTEAKLHTTKAISIHPNYRNAYLIKGNAHFYLKEYEEAINNFQHILSTVPDYKEAKKNLAIAYREAGKYYGQEKNDLIKSLENLEKAYQMMPDEYETVRLYGIANALAGNNKTALELFSKGIELEPGNAGAFLNLGNVYYNMDDPDNARVFHARALELDPNILDKK